MAGALLAGLPRELTQVQQSAVRRGKGPALRGLAKTVYEVIEQEAPRIIKETARKLSSGPYSRADLRRMGHPYSARRPRPPMPAYVLNVQTLSGGLRDKWRVEVSRQGTAVTLDVTNDAPYFDYLVGKSRPRSRMIRRPILEEIKAQLEPRLSREIADLVRRRLGV